MGDPLSMAAAVAGLVSLADVVLTKTYHYVSVVNSAEKSIKELVKLLESMYGTLTVLKSRLRVLDSLSTSSTSLYTRPGIMDDCTKLLDDINQKLAHYDFGKNAPKWKQHLQKLRWPFEASQTNELVEQLGRFNHVLITALQGDTLSAVYETFRAAGEIRGDIKKLERSLSVKINNLIETELNKEQQEAFNHYNRCDPTTYHTAAKRLCQQGSGKWFTDGTVFTAWCEGTRPKIWLSGIPGAGKTVLASSIIQRARLQIAQISEPTALVYFYCDYKDPQTQVTDNIINTIAAQLARQATDAMNLLTQQYIKFHKPGRNSVLNEPPELIDTLQSLCACFKSVFLVVDGFDECGKNMGKVTKILNRIASITNTKIRCILLSRDELDIRNVLLPEFEEIKIGAQSYDLKLFVHSKLEDIDVDDPAFKSEILETLINGAKGMFRWVACQIDYLRDLPSTEERKEALHQLPPDLNSTYDRILDVLNKKPSPTQELVRLTLTWLIVGPKTGLTFTGLREALSVRCGQSSLQRERIPNEQTVLRHCSSFVRRSANGTHLELAHFTVAEYLKKIPVLHSTLSQYRIDIHTGSSLLAKLCLTYLKFEDFKDIRSLTKDRERAREYRFRAHAVKQWFHYARSSLANETCFTMVKDFCEDVSSASHLMWLYDYVWYNSNDYHQWLQLDEEMASELSSYTSDSSETDGDEEKIEYNGDFKEDEDEVKVGYNGDYKEHGGDYHGDLILRKMQGWAPIHCASILRLPEIVRHLSHRDDVVNTKSAAGYPLHLVLLDNAAFTGYFEDCIALSFDHYALLTIRTLFEAGADPNGEWCYSHEAEPRSTLQLFLEIDFQKTELADCITLLLNAGLRLDRRAMKSLDYASLDKLFGLYPNVIKLDDIPDGYKAEWLELGGRFLSRHDEVLLTEPRDTDHEDIIHTLLRTAAQADQVDVLKNLLSREEINVDALDDRKRSALSLAAENGSSQAIRLLLHYGADINMCDVDNRTVFHYAILSGDVDAAKLIYRSGPYTDLEDLSGKNAWHYAVERGHIAILKSLMADSKNSESFFCAMLSQQNSVLFAAAEASRDEAVTLLTQLPGTAVVRDFEGRNLGHYSAYLKLETLTELVGRGLDCTQKDNYQNNTLHSFCKAGCGKVWSREIINLLLENSHQKMDGCICRNIALPLRPKHHSLLAAEVEVPDQRENRQSDRKSGSVCINAMLNSVNTSGDTPLDLLLQYHWSSPAFFDKSFDYLASFGAEPASQKSCDRFMSVVLLPSYKSEERSLHVIAKLVDTWKRANSPVIRKFIQRIGYWAAWNSHSSLLGKALDAKIDVLEAEERTPYVNILEIVCQVEHETHLVERVFQDLTHDQIAKSRLGVNSLLHNACRSFSTSSHIVITQLLTNRWDVNEQEKLTGYTPLMVATQAEKVEHMNVLLGAGADVGLRDKDGSTVFEHAIANSSTPCIMQLAEHSKDEALWWRTFSFYLDRYDDNTKIIGSNILHLASSLSGPQVIATILSIWPTVDLGQGTMEDLTPLHVACICESGEVVDFLIEKGVKTEVQDNLGRTPLHHAASRTNLSIIRALCEHGADVNASDSGRNTPLHAAAKAGLLPSVKYLLSRGARSIRNREGLTPELLAHTAGHKGLANSIAHHFLQETDSDAPGQYQTSELARVRIFNSFLRTIGKGDKKVIEDMIKLLDTTADPPCSGCTPVSTALREGRIDLIELLLELGYTTRSYECKCVGTDRFNTLQLIAAASVPDAIIRNLFSTLHHEDQQLPLSSYIHPAIVAAAQNKTLYLESFLQFYCQRSPETSDLVQSIRIESPITFHRRLGWPIEKHYYSYEKSYGASMLHIASALNNVDSIQILTAYTALINATDNAFTTPLHCAVAYGAIEAVDLLLDYGADIEARTAWGTTPLFLAASYRKDVLVHKLLQRGAKTHFSNVQLYCSTAMFNSWLCRTALLATAPTNYDFDIPSVDTSSFSHELTSICFTSKAMISAFNARPWALGHYILFNGMQMLKPTLKWLKLHGVLAQQLEYQKPSALCLAAQYGDPEVVDILLENGADMNVKGCDEGTPLTLACKINRLKVVKYLVRRGARLSYTDLDGREITCFDAAVMQPHILQWLLVGRHVEQRCLKDINPAGEFSSNTEVIKPWSGLLEVKSRLPPEFKQARGETLLDWHIRKRHDLRVYEGKVLRYGEDIEYPFVNYK